MEIKSFVKQKALILFVILGVILTGGEVIGVNSAFAQVEPPDVEVVNPYFTRTKIETKDGVIERGTISGPPKPLPEFEAERQASIQPLPSEGVIPGFPSYSWVFGCSAVSGAMIAGYYDNNGYPDMYAGPTNGGVMPDTDTFWPTWSDGYVTYPNNPLIASHNGIDGRTTKGSIDDYWVKYDSTTNDPYLTGGWSQHMWSDAIGDFMKTSQSDYGNTDGASTFYNYNSISDKLTCDDMEVFDDGGVFLSELDGTYGRKEFYEARGYSVGDCYNQNTDNNIPGGFSLGDFQAEIDAGRPVLLNLVGHSIVGYGYDGDTIYIRDTWDNDTGETYTMIWGDSYSGMELYSVSVVHLEPPVSPTIPSTPTGVTASDGTLMDRVGVSWNVSLGATYYKIFRNTNDNHTGETEISVSHAPDKFNDFTAVEDQTYYYWVKACNSSGCSGYSVSDSGYRTESYGLFLPIVMKYANMPTEDLINGDFEQGHVGWTEYSSGYYELIIEVSSGAHSGSWIAYLGGYHNAVDQLYQDVTITASEPWLHFYGWIDSEDACGYDYFFLVFGGDLVGYVSLCSDNNTGGWGHFIVDMSDYIGSTDTLLFDVETDGSLYSDFFLDTVYLSATGGSTSGSSIFIKGAPEGYEPKPLMEGTGFRQKDINR